MSTGQIIKDLRKEKRITQTDLANGVHVTQQTVTAWESGRAIPNANTLNALANYFNVSSDYLLGRTKERNSNKEMSENQKLVAYSIDPDISDEERNDIIEMVKIAMKNRRRV
ncbi:MULTISPECIES: helix-turn-helix domain-containing protein [Limosilactobacillus]|uniref:Helix-turn-helix transcriptional regulator n=1 Tax=Limosilactobacillus avistercoris TaxID=2762243 RepID=A0ABR8PBC3_9LACO|nr:helix-turn-helix transcriptional regulator [Limosilactobacillus avistercoris]MBD7894589.1 helix-turn-helix transcriptional regulator [Limosilactobacillus avistercoris]